MRDQPPRDSKKINAENALRKCPQGKLRAQSSLRREEEEKAETSTAASKKRRPPVGMTVLELGEEWRKGEGIRITQRPKGRRVARRKENGRW
jgi:hypothetical protein